VPEHTGVEVTPAPLQQHPPIDLEAVRVEARWVLRSRESLLYADVLRRAGSLRVTARQMADGLEQQFKLLPDVPFRHGALRTIQAAREKTQTRVDEGPKSARGYSRSLANAVLTLAGLASALEGVHE
jgi:hypothetical protein